MSGVCVHVFSWVTHCVGNGSMDEDKGLSIPGSIFENIVSQLVLQFKIVKAISKLQKQSLPKVCR